MTRPAKSSEPARPRLAIIATSPDALWVFFREQVRHLKGAEFDVIAISPPGDRLGQFQVQTGAVIHAVPMNRAFSVFADIASIIRLAKLLRKIRPDIVHSHMPKAGLLGMSAAVLAGVKQRFHTFHGLRSQIETGFRRRILHVAECLTCALSTSLLAVSESLREQLSERGICSANRVKVLGKGACAGVNLSLFDPDEPNLNGQVVRSRYGIPEDALLLLYVGRIAKDKGVEELASAWSVLKERFPALRLLLCGPFDDTDPVSPKIVEMLRTDDRVTMTGELEQNMPPVYAASDICVLPSHREGLGVAALEASAMRLPVVACRVTGLVDAVLDGTSGILVPPGDPAALSTAIESLVGDPELRRRLGIAGRELVEAHFSSDRISELLIAFYRKQLAEARHDWVKRAIDLVGSAMLLVLTSPVLAAAIVFTRFTLGKPVFFHQSRAGLHGRVFTLHKLRTLTDRHSSDGQLLPDVDRETAAGRFLRATSLDELPQLWNVLRGDMSLVGPRPLLASYLPRYSPFQMRRHDVRPGITGWTQVHGRNELSWSDKFRFDVWYVEHRSFRLDMYILLKTMSAPFLSRGVKPSDQASTREFLGS